MKTRFRYKDAPHFFWPCDVSRWADFFPANAGQLRICRAAYRSHVVCPDGLVRTGEVRETNNECQLIYERKNVQGLLERCYGYDFFILDESTSKYVDAIPLTYEGAWFRTLCWFADNEDWYVNLRSSLQDLQLYPLQEGERRISTLYAESLLHFNRLPFDNSSIPTDVSTELSY